MYYSPVFIGLGRYGEKLTKVKNDLILKGN